MALRLPRRVIGNLGSSNPVGTERLSEYEGRDNAYYLTPDIGVCTLTGAPVNHGGLGTNF